jgi:serine/threonine-protein kinase RsbW
MNLLEKLPSDLKKLPRCIDAIITHARTLPLTDEQLHDIKLSLEEALVNAIKHGNKFDPRLWVSVLVESNDRGLTIIVTDQGNGFDFKNVPDPTKNTNLTRLSGRGVYLIRNRMDKVEFLSGGSSIKMTKYFENGENR